MIKVVIVDDDLTVQKRLKQFIGDYENEVNFKFSVTTFTNASQMIKQYKPIYDIIFMDIQMDGMDGMTASEKIRAVDKEVIIIFVTNMVDYAIKGYKVDALSYIVKPIMYVDFAQQLNKVVKRIEYSYNAYILVKINGEIVRLDISKICYMESVEHTVIIHMENENLTTYSSLKKLEEQVEGYHFARCNNGYLVSLRHVECIENNSVIVNEDHLIISRPKKQAFMNALTEYIGGEY